MEKRSQAFQEQKIHGKLDFPFAVYCGDIPFWFKSYPLHWHDEFEFIYVESGGGLVRVNDTVYDCTAGDIVFISPGKIHDIRQKQNLPMVYYNVLFKLTLLESDEESAFFREYLLPMQDGSLEFPEYFAVGTDKNAAMTMYLRPLVERWLFDFSKDVLLAKSAVFPLVNMVKRLGFTPAKASGTKKPSITRIKNLLNYIEQHYGEQISVETAASLTNYSPSFFMKFFKKVSGTTFVHYLMAYRLEQAEKLLRQTDMNVTEVSARCGFESLSYFIKCYKQRYGYTPHKEKKS